MTTFSDEALMAYADGELDSPTRDAVAAALRDDPQMAARVEQHRALKARVQAAYAAEVHEAPPERLLAVIRGAGTERSSNVSSLQDARIAVAERAQTRRQVAESPRTERSRRQLPLAMAASLLIGLGLGYLTWRQSGSVAGDGAVVAQGTLARALSNDLGGDRSPASQVQVGLSFLAKSGSYCRLFSLVSESSVGVACHQAGAWHIQALVAVSDGATGAGSTETYRTAGNAMPAVILDVIQRQMVGEPLDGNAEKAARQNGWQRHD